MRIKGRVAIVTGGASGIGQGICIRLGEEGAKIAVFDVDIEAAENTARMISNMGSTAAALKVDVSRASEVNGAVKDVISSFGSVDIIVNNAGVNLSSSIARTTAKVWDRVHDVNLKSVFLCCRAVIPHMKERRHGRILNVSSILGLTGSPGMVHYGSAKTGVIGFTRGLATELGPYNITVNAIGPGIIDTPMLDRETGADLLERLAQRIPLRRIGTPRDVADAALFLVSDEASYITGQCLFVCGGWSADAGLF